MTTMKILWLYFQYDLLCEKFHNVSVPNNGYMVDCFFLHHEMISHEFYYYLFYTDIEEIDIIVFFLGNLNFWVSCVENGSADFGNTYIIL